LYDIVYGVWCSFIRHYLMSTGTGQICLYPHFRQQLLSRRCEHTHRVATCLCKCLFDDSRLLCRTCLSQSLVCCWMFMPGAGVASVIEFSHAPPTATLSARGKESVPMLGQAYAMPFYGVSVWLMLSLYAQCFSHSAKRKGPLLVYCSYSGWTRTRCGLQLALLTYAL
jgi:hypothetical protein